MLKLSSIKKYDPKTGNISEKIAYAEDGMSVSSISTFDPKTGTLLKEQLWINVEDLVIQ